MQFPPECKITCDACEEHVTRQDLHIHRVEVWDPKSSPFGWRCMKAFKGHKECLDELREAIDTCQESR